MSRTPGQSGGGGGGAGTLVPADLLPELYGPAAVKIDDYDLTGGADFTQALIAAMADAVARAQASGLQTADVFVEPRAYPFAGPLVQGGAGKTNAMVPLPWNSTANRKIALMIRCLATPGAPWATAQQATDQASGARFVIGRNDFAYSGVYGVPSFIGGPTHLQAGAAEFNNMIFGIDGIRIMLPANPTMTGVDLSHLSQVDCGWLGIESAYTAWAFGIGPNVAAPTNPHNFGIIMPSLNNNAWCNVRRLYVVGMYAGACISEHANFNFSGILSCRTAFTPMWGDGGGHMCFMPHAIVEKCRHIIASSDPSGPGIVPAAGGVSHRARLDFMHCEIEDTNNSQIGDWNEPGHEHLVDPSSIWRGQFRFTRTSPGNATPEPTTITFAGAATITKTGLRQA